MAKYITTQDIWNILGEDAYVKVRSEIIGTGSGTYQTFSLAKDNLISASTILYSNGTTVSNYTTDLDDGKISITTGNSVVYTADYDYGTLPDSTIATLIEQAEAELEYRTGRNFNLTTTSEYLDVELDSDYQIQKTFWLSQYPVTSLIALSANTATSINGTPTWSSRTEGLGADFLLEGDAENRFITFIDNFPNEGKKRLKATYSYGFSSSAIPYPVKELATLLTQKRLINSGIYRSVVKGDNVQAAQLAELDNRIKQLYYQLAKQSIDKI